MRAHFDAAVIGGGVTGVLSAITLAAKGQSVVLITDKVVFLDEFTAAIRPWLYGSEAPAEESCFRQIFKMPVMAGNDLAVYKNADIKRNVLRLLEQWHISLVIDHAVCGFAESDKKACGVVTASKFGIEIIYANNIVDARVFAKEEAYTIEITHAEPFQSGMVAIDGMEGFAVSGGENNSAFLSFPASSQEEAASLAAKWIDHMKSMTGLSAAHAYYCGYGLKVSPKAICRAVGSYENVYYVACALTPYISSGMLEAAESFVKKELSQIKWNTQMRDMTAICIGEKISKDDLTFIDSPDINAEFRMDRILFDYSKYIAVAGCFDVAVVGAGTGGTAAAAAAGRNCGKTVLIDRMPAFGGTQSFGLVYSYYHGYQNGYAALATYSAMSQLNGLSPLKRMIYYMQDAMQNNVHMLTQAWVCGAIVRNAKAEGVLYCRDAKLQILNAKVVIDATGDGDYAAFAGAEFILGSDRDGMIQDCSQWEIGGDTKDTDVIHQTIYSDYLRAVRLAHYQEGASDYAMLLTVREGRRFVCDYQLDMRDIILKTQHEDCICLAKTDCDPHGGMSAQISMMGLTPYHGDVIVTAVPYRSCIPTGLEGVLLGGKAAGATQDAIAYLRMSADVQNKCYALGLLAADAALRDVSVRKADVTGIQKILLNMQIINKENLPGNSLAIDSGAVITRALDGDMDSFAKLLCLDKGRILQQLEAAYDKEKNILTAVALGWFGSKIGLSQLIARLDVLADEPQNLSYSDDHPWKVQNNKGGIMYNEYEPYWEANQILTVLGIIGDKSAVGAIKKVIEHTTSGGPPRQDEASVFKGRIDLKKVPHFDRIRILDFCITVFADEALCPALEALMDKPHMYGYVSTALRPEQAGLYTQPVYTELLAARMAARCGSDKGRRKLEKLKSDVHYVISKNAADELAGVQVSHLIHKF